MTLVDEIIEQFKKIEAERLELDRKSKKLKDQENNLKTQIADMVRHGATASRFSVTVETKMKPTIVDWNRLYEYVRQNNYFDLLQRRVTESAIEARWLEGEDVPGVDKFPVDKLHIHTL